MSQGMSFLFKNLRVYQKAVDFAEDIFCLTETFPKGTYCLADQINRAALSISLNIAEGNGRWHKPERRQFFYIARGSCFECVPVLEICHRRKFIADVDLNLRTRRRLQSCQTHACNRFDAQVLAKFFVRQNRQLREFEFDDLSEITADL